ncbi:hypothetical protein [Microvirgula aerodenitrificans]|uniref:hypothetical protein n=1 Tax=Microvirgula aerodenitrificans TaxID=57480 RepID=UPI001F40E075|nr:hypothetical protein [Microvirgula aerodenitrificans]
MIRKARPYWATFSNASYLKELAVGNIWVSLGYSTEFFQAQEDARAAKRKFSIAMCRSARAMNLASTPWRS